mgnify:CR=1 FL=1
MVTGVGGHGVILVGLLGRTGAGACPDLLQRRLAAGSALSRSAEYQRFSPCTPARSGPLQQIWTTCAAEGSPEGCRGPGGGRGGRSLTPRRALRTRKCSSNRCSRVQNAHLDEEGAGVAVLADRGADPAPEHLRRPGEKGASYFMLRINPGASVLVDREEGRLPGLPMGERGAVRSMRSEDGSGPSKIPALASIPGPREGSAARDAGPVRARAPPPIGRSTEIIRPGRPIGLTNGMSGSDGWRVLSQF